jgi:hypothetical protein
VSRDMADTGCLRTWARGSDCGLCMVQAQSPVQSHRNIDVKMAHRTPSSRATARSSDRTDVADGLHRPTALGWMPIRIAVGNADVLVVVGDDDS